MWVLSHIYDIFTYACAISLGLYFFLKYSKWQAPVAIGAAIFAVYIAAIAVTIISGIYYLIRLFI